MKFIKTKNNKIYIFKSRERYSNQSFKMVDRYQELGTEHVCAYGQHILNKNNIDKESDNLKDLCSRCVVLLKYDAEPFCGTFYEFEHWIEQWTKNIPSNNPVTAIYGAIWTETGLKYICELTRDGNYVPFTK